MNLKDIINPPKTVQMLSKNINTQRKKIYLCKKNKQTNFYSVTKLKVIVCGPCRPQR